MNKAYLKDSFPLPKIDMLVDATTDTSYSVSWMPTPVITRS